jgi:predicted DNA-binding transcriptional regulator AlpA
LYLLTSVHHGTGSAMPVHIGKDKQKHPRSIDGFCARWGICRASFYNLRKQNKAPAILRVGSRSIITPEAEAEWASRNTEAA